MERQADQLQRTGLSRIKYGGNNYYYICNLQNDMIGILDSAGTQVVNYVYDSWGKLASIWNSVKTRFSNRSF